MTTHRVQKDQLIAFNLATGHSIAEAASSIGVSEKTIRRRLKDPEFSNIISEIQNCLFRECSAKLVHGVSKAADTIVALLDSPSDSVRLSAATRLIELAPKCHEYFDLWDMIGRLTIKVKDMLNSGEHPEAMNEILKDYEELDKARLAMRRHSASKAF